MGAAKIPRDASGGLVPDQPESIITITAINLFTSLALILDLPLRILHSWFSEFLITAKSVVETNIKKGKLVPQVISEYFEAEVKPHLPKAWIDESKTKIGYEINFTKYFYEFKPLRSLAEIKADILTLEEKTLETEKTVLE